MLSFCQSATNNELEGNITPCCPNATMGLSRGRFLAGACQQVIHKGNKGLTLLSDCLSSQLYSLDVKFSILPATFIFVS